MLAKKTYILTCKRCKRPFISTHSNTLFCDMPSPYPEDKGRTCKEMRRIESKQKSIKRKDNLQNDIDSGIIVYSDRFGYLKRDEWMSRFHEFLRESHNLGPEYSDIQKWILNNAEQTGLEYEQFQSECGMKVFNEKDFVFKEEQKSK